MEIDELITEIDVAAIRRAINVLFEPNQILEVRCLIGNDQSARIGYYNDPEKIVGAISRFSDDGSKGCYWTIQRIEPEVAETRKNGEDKQATRDSDISGYRWLPIDCDPKRPSEVSATDAEKRAALDVAHKVRQYFREIGFDSILADSGNGYHVLLRVDLECNAQSKDLMRRTLRVLSDQFSNGAVCVDVTIFNPSRILKAYGSVARKGPNLPDRPHRLSRIIEIPAELKPLPVDLLKEIADGRASDTPNSPIEVVQATDFNKASQRADKLEGFMREASINFRSRLPYDGGWKWILESCPFNPAHSGTSVIAQVLGNGALAFTCLHHGCADNKWEQFKDHLEHRIGRPVVFSDHGSPLTSDNPVVVPFDEWDYDPAEKAIIRKHVADDDDSVSPFPLHVIRGFAQDVVDVVCKNNTLPPQFAFAILKTVIGLAASGKIKLPVEVENPHLYTMLVGATGSGKGETYRRINKIFLRDPEILAIMQVLDSADSGAGLKDAFFDKDDEGNPKPTKIMLYIDELMDFANKVRPDRQPDILATILTLANDTTIGRTKATGKDRAKATVTCQNARLALIMCAQPAYVQNCFVGTRAVATGLYPRINPEFAEVEDVDSPLQNISETDISRLRELFKKLPLEGEMVVSPEAKAAQESYWRGKPQEYRRTHSRSLADLYLHAYFQAITQNRLTVLEQDMLDSIELCERMEAIRKIHFSEDVPDRVGFYLAKIKHAVFKLEEAIAGGKKPEDVAMTRRQFVRACNAGAANEDHYFQQAWNVYVQDNLASFEITGRNNRKTRIYYPK